MFTIDEVKIPEYDFYLNYNRIKSKFNYFNGYKNNCSNTVKTFLSEVNVDVSEVTAYADTVRNLGEIQFNPKLLQVGDIVAMGIPGDTWHVGVYMGDDKVLHQSASRGYEVGVYNDLHAFINHHSGFYYVRPNYPIQYILRDYFIAPEIV